MNWNARLFVAGALVVAAGSIIGCAHGPSHLDERRSGRPVVLRSGG